MHNFKPHGYTSSSSKRYKHWPIWKTVTHQQVWEGWLKKAHDDGLNLIVMSAVNFRYICGIMAKKNGFDDRSGGVPPCEDMKNIKRQIQAAHAFARETEERTRVEKELSGERDRLKATAGALRGEVTAREAVERELKETKAALEAALESKTQFLAAIGQQIQNHLSASGEAAVAPEGDAEDPGEDAKVTPLRRGRGAK